MSDQPSETPKNTTGSRVVFVALSIYLILTFLWRFLTPAHEWDSSFDVYFTIGLDLLCVVAMIALKSQLAKAMPEQSGLALEGILFWVAIVASLGLFWIRFLHGENGWWTGHWIYTLR